MHIPVVTCGPDQDPALRCGCMVSLCSTDRRLGFSDTETVKMNSVKIVLIMRGVMKAQIGTSERKL